MTKSHKDTAKTVGVFQKIGGFWSYNKYYYNTFDGNNQQSGVGEGALN